MLCVHSGDFSINLLIPLPPKILRNYCKLNIQLVFRLHCALRPIRIRSNFNYPKYLNTA